MIGHLLWWLGRSTRNRIRRRVRQLRNPRYLVALIFGIAYFWFIFGGWFRDDEYTSRVVPRQLEAAALIGPFALALLTARWWLWGGHRRAILFTPAETHLLLPAPVPRTTLIAFKLMQAQVPILASATLFSLFTRGAPLPWPLRLLSLWLMFATLHLHQVAASLVHASAEQHGRRGIRSNIIPVVLFSGAFLVLAATLARAAVALRNAAGLRQALDAVAAALAAPAPQLVLTPFRLLLAPLTAASLSEWAPAAGIVAVLLVLHYAWVLRSDAAFEETAAVEGERRAQAQQQMRGGAGRAAFSRQARPRRLARPWLPLPPTGLAAYAVYWKNMLFVQRLLRPLTLLLIAGLAGVMIALNWSMARSPTGALRASATQLLLLAGLVTLLGALMFRNDLRLDLRHIDMLRTWPLRGRDVVGAGVAAAATCMTALQFVLLVPGLVLAAAGGLLPVRYTIGIAAGAMVGLPVLNALAALIQNAVALLFPAWTRIGEQAGGGVEAMGQNMVNLIGTVVMVIIAAVPPVIVAGIVGAPLAMQFGALAAGPAAAAFIAAVGVEVVLATRWLGRMFDTLDPVEAELLR